MKSRREMFLYLQFFVSAATLISSQVELAARSSMNEVEAKVTCTFDVDLCNWQHSSNDDFDWTLISGPTPTSGTGPSNDHTQGSSAGKYIFIETSAPRRLNEKAELVSPLIDTWNNNYMCFSLWFNAYGSNIGGLRVLFQQTQYVNKTEVLWEYTSGGATWTQTSMSILPTGPFKIIIEGMVGDGYLGDVAVDDVAISEGKCSKNTSGDPSVVG